MGDGPDQAAITTIWCQPVEPFGNGSVRSSVWIAPFASIARTLTVWRPGVACHGRLHWRHVLPLTAVARAASVHGPSSTRTCTAPMPTGWAQATPAIATV